MSMLSDITLFEWLSLLLIISVAILGGYYPLMRRDKARGREGFPAGESFTAGVFLALALTIMLPAGYHLFNKAFPEFNYPIASIVAIASFLLLLAIEHVTMKLAKSHTGRDTGLSDPVIPIIMTVMIAIPSFLLGTALGVSRTFSAVFILVAILAHKSSAGFGLALTMARSTLTRVQTYIVYGLFVISTPLGILVGADIHQFLKGDIMLIVKAFILSAAAGIFLYMCTLHGFRDTPLVKHCSGVKGFSIMLAGLILTALVRLMLGLAHGG
ncbi:MAG: ZIP family metal transporter [Candidatus Omnitrophica bacterium]|nr:ZIP family metal transporter [Candidatus Omnitrophota bacterium]